jgi:hypothetical protein
MSDHLKILKKIVYLRKIVIHKDYLKNEIKGRESSGSLFIVKLKNYILVYFPKQYNWKL